MWCSLCKKVVKKTTSELTELSAHVVKFMKEGRQEDFFLKIEQCEKNNSRKNHKDN